VAGTEGEGRGKLRWSGSGPSWAILGPREAIVGDIAGSDRAARLRRVRELVDDESYTVEAVAAEFFLLAIEERREEIGVPPDGVLWGFPGSGDGGRVALLLGDERVYSIAELEDLAEDALEDGPSWDGTSRQLDEELQGGAKYAAIFDFFVAHMDDCLVEPAAAPADGQPDGEGRE
jgi:hypothetical protein